jgi:hypothetical protein
LLWQAAEQSADFQIYAGAVQEPLKKAGIDFYVVYARSFRVRVGKSVTRFRPGKVDVGYYFIVPGKEPRIQYGVMTDADLLQAAAEYFGQDGRINNDDEVRLRATVKAIVPLADFSGAITPVDVDPRFALTVRIETAVPAVPEFGAGAVVTLGIHSPSLLLGVEPAQGKTYEFLLHRRIEDRRLWWISMARWRSSRCVCGPAGLAGRARGLPP